MTDRRRRPRAQRLTTNARENDHEAGRSGRRAVAVDDEVAAALVERFPGARLRREPRPARRLRRPRGLRRRRGLPARRAAVHDAASTSPRSTTCSTARATRPPGVELERFEVVANYLSHARNRRIRVICEVPADDPTVPSLTPRVSGRELPRARDVRHVRHQLRRPPRPHAHPHARRLGRPPAAQGLPAGTRPGDVQGTDPDEHSRDRPDTDSAPRARRTSRPSEQ